MQADAPVTNAQGSDSICFNSRLSTKTPRSIQWVSKGAALAAPRKLDRCEELMRKQHSADHLPAAVVDDDRDLIDSLVIFVAILLRSLACNW
jgi:hypothetical protein